MMEILQVQKKFKNIVICVNDAIQITNIMKYLKNTEFIDVDFLNEQSNNKKLEAIENKWSSLEDVDKGSILICQEVIKRFEINSIYKSYTVFI
jgi:hypothetical protein